MTDTRLADLYDTYSETKPAIRGGVEQKRHKSVPMDIDDMAYYTDDGDANSKSKSKGKSMEQVREIPPARAAQERRGRKDRTTSHAGATVAAKGGCNTSQCGKEARRASMVPKGGDADENGAETAHDLGDLYPCEVEVVWEVGVGQPSYICVRCGN